MPCKRSPAAPSGIYPRPCSYHLTTIYREGYRVLLTLLQFFATKFLFLALHLESGCFPRPLTAREEAAAFNALRAGDAAAREKLIRHNLRLVAHIVKKYYALPGDQEDLVSIGTIGLMKAVDTFDSTRRARFSTYASRCIENAILSPAHFQMEKRTHSFCKAAQMRQNGFSGAERSVPFFLLQRVSCEGRGLTPLYILQVSLAGPRTTVEAQAFFHMYHSYSEITNPSDRLRWCRYGLDLLQKEVATMVSMEEWLYRNLESGAFHRSFTPELADKLAALYGIPVEDILDDYTLFLHRGGGAFLRRYREAKGWNRQQLADHAKVGRTSIRCWENGQKTISQKCFDHLVENLGSDFPSMLRM